MNKNKQFGEQQLRYLQGVNAYLTIPMTNEALEVSQDLKNALNDCISEIPFRGLIDEQN
jgi:hypothetical protein